MEKKKSFMDELLEGNAGKKDAPEIIEAADFGDDGHDDQPGTYDEPLDQDMPEFAGGNETPAFLVETPTELPTEKPEARSEVSAEKPAVKAAISDEDAQEWNRKISALFDSTRDIFTARFGQIEKRADEVLARATVLTETLQAEGGVAITDLQKAVAEFYRQAKTDMPQIVRDNTAGVMQGMADAQLIIIADDLKKYLRKIIDADLNPAIAQLNARGERGWKGYLKIALVAATAGAGAFFAMKLMAWLVAAFTG